MRRNPRPLRPIDRRRLVMQTIEREARSTPMSSQKAIEGTRDRELPRDLPTLRLPKR